MLLSHDVVADREAEAGPFPGRLGREEWLEQLVLDLRRNAGAVVPDADLDRITEIPRRNLQGRPEIRVVSLLLPFGGRIEAVAEKIEAQPGNVLRHQFDRDHGMSEVPLQR